MPLQLYISRPTYINSPLNICPGVISRKLETCIFQGRTEFALVTISGSPLLVRLRQILQDVTKYYEHVLGFDTNKTKVSPLFSRHRLSAAPSFAALASMRQYEFPGESCPPTFSASVTDPAVTAVSSTMLKRTLSIDPFRFPKLISFPKNTWHIHG